MSVGDRQISCLRGMMEYSYTKGTYSNRAGWLWDTPSNTARIFESLAKRGLVTKRQLKGAPGVTEYVITAEGRKLAKRK